MISKYSEDQIKQRASIAEVVGDYVKLKKSGADFEAVKILVLIVLLLL